MPGSKPTPTLKPKPTLSAVLLDCPLFTLFNLLLRLLRRRVCQRLPYFQGHSMVNFACKVLQEKTLLHKHPRHCGKIHVSTWTRLLRAVSAPDLGVRSPTARSPASEGAGVSRRAPPWRCCRWRRRPGLGRTCHPDIHTWWHDIPPPESAGALAAAAVRCCRSCSADWCPPSRLCRAAREWAGT